MLIIFNGLPGSGKNTVAKLLSKKLMVCIYGLIRLSRRFVQHLNRTKKLALRVILFFMSWRVKIYS